LRPHAKPSRARSSVTPASGPQSSRACRWPAARSRRSAT